VSILTGEYLARILMLSSAFRCMLLLGGALIDSAAGDRQTLLYDPTYSDSIYLGAHLEAPKKLRTIWMVD